MNKVGCTSQLLLSVDYFGLPIENDSIQSHTYRKNFLQVEVNSMPIVLLLEMMGEWVRQGVIDL